MFRAFCVRFHLAFLLFVFLGLPPAFSEELLNEEHPHYSQQKDRIRQALGSKEDKSAEDAALILDAHRSMRWIFEEPEAAETEEERLTKRISKEFSDLDLPVVIHPERPRSVLQEKVNSFSSLLLNYSTNQILVTVSVPYFQDSGVRKAKNEAVFLSILLLQDGIMDISVDGKTTIGQSVSGKITGPGSLMEQYISTNGLSPSGLSVDIKGLAAGGGLATAHISVPIPLHIGGDLSREIVEKTHLPPDTMNTDLEKPLRTGLIIDARHLGISPFRDPVLLSDQNMRLFSPDEGRSSTSVPYGWAGWEDGLSPEIAKKRVGLHPLVVRPLQMINNHVFLLSGEDAHKVEQSFHGTKLLSSGHMVILVRPLTPEVPRPSTVTPARSRQ